MKLNTWISRYLNIVIVLPTVLLVALVSWQVIDHAGKLRNADTGIELLNMADRGASLVHELQKERGMSAGYLGSQGATFASELRAQRANTDQRMQAYDSYLNAERMSGFSDRISESIEAIRGEFSQLDQMRAKVDSFSVSIAEMLAYYTDKNQILIEQPLIIIRYIDNKFLVEDIIAMYNLMEVKEKSGIERAVLSNLLAQGAFPDDLRARVYSLIAQQVAYEDGFVKSVSYHNLDAYDTFRNGSANQRVLELRETALAGLTAGRGDVESTVWFAAATDRIDALKTLEASLIQEMLHIIQDTYYFEWQTVLASLAMMVFVALSGVLVLSNIKRMGNQAREIKNTLTHVIDDHDLTLRVPVLGFDNLGRSSDMINKLLDRIRDDFDSIASHTFDSVSSTQDTIVAIVQSEENIRKQLSQTTMTATAVEEMASSIEEVSRNIDSTAVSVNDAMGECNMGQEAVVSAVKAIETVAVEIGNLNSNIHSLDRRVDDISTVLEVIQSVAEQTNLLALNAAIEAARAGEQGRGFAVVADEVRQLAQRVQGSTEEISTIIGSLQTDSKSAIGVIDQARQKSEHAVEQSDAINESLTRIVETMGRVNDMAVGISESGRQQSTVTQEMTESVTFIDQMSQENLIGAEEISKSASALSAMTMELMDTVELYKISDEKRYLIPSEWKYGTRT